MEKRKPLLIQIIILMLQNGSVATQTQYIHFTHLNSRDQNFHSKNLVLSIDYFAYNVKKKVITTASSFYIA